MWTPGSRAKVITHRLNQDAARINAARSNGFAIRDPPPGWNKTGHRG